MTKNKKYKKKMNFYKINSEAFEAMTEGEHIAPTPPTFTRSSFILEHQVTNINETANSTSRKRKNGKSTS